MNNKQAPTDLWLKVWSPEGGTIWREGKDLRGAREGGLAG